eukprot:gene14830-19924_t
MSNDYKVDTRDMLFSSLQGKALRFKEFPTLSNVKSILPADHAKKDTIKSLSFAFLDVLTISIASFTGIKFLFPYLQKLLASSSPVNVLFAGLLWGIYSFITGTVGIGMWVTAHECGHGAFSDNRKLQDFVGFIFHSFLLVPYFSWQRSHAVHHANTNHMVDGETHVPPYKIRATGTKSPKRVLQFILGDKIGEFLFGFGEVFAHLAVGWPAYILFGATGGYSRGFTNHFIPFQFKRPLELFPGINSKPLKDLFPNKMKVFASDFGIGAMLVVLAKLVHTFGFWKVAAAYGGPLMVVNAWLVAYTWLQHTDVDIPHLDADNFSFIKGAFHTVDRPYDKMFGNPIIDFLHHHIGSTHVAHHIDSTIPHYRAKAATEAIKNTYPDLYLYEDTPIFKALWRVAAKCYEVEQRPTTDGEN